MEHGVEWVLDMNVYYLRFDDLLEQVNRRTHNATSRLSVGLGLVHIELDTFFYRHFSLCQYFNQTGWLCSLVHCNFIWFEFLYQIYNFQKEIVGSLFLVMLIESSTCFDFTLIAYVFPPDVYPCAFLELLCLSHVFYLTCFIHLNNVLYASVASAIYRCKY